jgi:hypothetical protein
MVNKRISSGEREQREVLGRMIEAASQGKLDWLERIILKCGYRRRDENVEALEKARVQSEQARAVKIKLEREIAEARLAAVRARQVR